MTAREPTIASLMEVATEAVKAAYECADYQIARDVLDALDAAGYAIVARANVASGCECAVRFSRAGPPVVNIDLGQP